MNKQEPIDFFDAEGNRIGTLDATAPKHEFNPDWDQMAVLVTHSQEQAAKIEQLEKKLAERSAEYLAAHITHDKGYQEGRQDAEDAHKEFVEPMTEVADRFAHRMALELECVLSDGAYSNKWYTSAMQVLSEYRSAMNEIHEQHSPTFMGEPKL